MEEPQGCPFDITHTHIHTHTHTHTQTHTQNFRTSNDINIELGGLTKLDKRNATATKKKWTIMSFFVTFSFLFTVVFDLVK